MIVDDSGSFVAYYASGTGAYSYNGQNDALLSDLNRQVQVGVTTVASAGFNSGTSTVLNGQVTTFTVVVPEPATLALAALGAGLAAWGLRVAADTSPRQNGDGRHAAPRQPIRLPPLGVLRGVVHRLLHDHAKVENERGAS